jgi:hypothetical protein
MPLPVVVTLPGLLINVHDPDEGNPLSTTDPVATVHVGWVMVPAVGAAGNEFTVTVTCADGMVPHVLLTFTTT